MTQYYNNAVQLDTAILKTNFRYQLTFHISASAGQTSVFELTGHHILNSHCCVYGAGRRPSE